MAVVNDCAVAVLKDKDQGTTSYAADTICQDANADETIANLKKIQVFTTIISTVSDPKWYNEKHELKPHEFVEQNTGLL